MVAAVFCGVARASFAVVVSHVPRTSGGAMAGGAAAFATFQQFLNSPQAKSARAALVCTPPSMRVPIIEAALTNGLSVLAEKPIARTVADAKTQADLAGRYPKLATAIGYCHR